MNAKDLRKRILVERVTVSCALTAGRRGDGEFVSLTVRATEGDFTLEEAHLVHKMVSKECTEMAYMDALVKGHMGREQVSKDLNARKNNYDKLIARLEKSDESVQSNT